MTSSKHSIGSENESSLHRSLKWSYAEDGQIEATRAGYVCDAIGSDGEAIEIQTGNFGALKKKLPALAESGKVRLIYPVIVKKTIELYSTDGKRISSRKSPKKGNVWDIFDELIYVPELLTLKRLTVEIIFVDAIERRRDDGKGSWRRKGVSITDRILENRRAETFVLTSKADWKRAFLPLKGEFSAKTLALAARVKPETARKTLYTLGKAGFITKLRKEGRSWIYGITPPGKRAPRKTSRR